MEIAYKKIKVEVAFWTRKKMIFPVDAIAACVMLKRSLQLGWNSYQILGVYVLVVFFLISSQ